MFILKLKGKPHTVTTNELTLKIKDNIKTVSTEFAINNILEKYEPEDIKIKIQGEFRQVWNLYFKDFNKAYLCEGLEDETK